MLKKMCGGGVKPDLVRGNKRLLIRMKLVYRMAFIHMAYYKQIIGQMTWMLFSFLIAQLGSQICQKRWQNCQKNVM